MSNKSSAGDSLTELFSDTTKVPLDKIVNSVRAITKQWHKKRIQKLQEDERKFTRLGLHRQLLIDYYQNTPNKSPLKQFIIEFNDRPYPTSEFSTDFGIGLSIPLQDISFVSTRKWEVPKYSKRFTKLAIKRAKGVRRDLLLRGSKFWNQEMFRLAQNPFKKTGLEFYFELSDYETYRFSSGLLGDEIFQALTETDGDVRRILKNRERYLPLRNELIPSMEDLLGVKKRVMAGGIVCTLAILRENDFCIPIQIRSEAVAESRSVYSSSLQAWHQPISVSYGEEVSFYWTVLRELYEEIFSGTEVTEKSRHFKHDWYVEKSPEVGFIHKNPEKVQIELLGCGLSASSGTYEAAILLIIKDPEYWNMYGSEVTQNWENEGGVLMSSLEINNDFPEFLNSGWLDQGFFSLSQALLRLHQLYPDKTADPKIKVFLR